MLVWGPLSFHDCAWGMSEVCVSKDMDTVPSLWAQLTMYTKNFIWEKTLLPLPLGLNWAPQKSPSHLFQAKFAWLPCPLLDSTNSLPRSQPCVTFHGHMGHSLCGHVCPHVCMCSARSAQPRCPQPPCCHMSQMSLPWLPSAVSWRHRGHRRSGSALWNRM